MSFSKQTFDEIEKAIDLIVVGNNLRKKYCEGFIKDLEERRFAKINFIPVEFPAFEKDKDKIIFGSREVFTSISISVEHISSIINDGLDFGSFVLVELVERSLEYFEIELVDCLLDSKFTNVYDGNGYKFDDYKQLDQMQMLIDPDIFIKEYKNYEFWFSKQFVPIFDNLVSKSDFGTLAVGRKVKMGFSNWLVNPILLVNPQDIYVGIHNKMKLKYYFDGVSSYVFSLVFYLDAKVRDPALVTKGINFTI
jgi:hypothetical protein